MEFYHQSGMSGIDANGASTLISTLDPKDFHH